MQGLHPRDRQGTPILAAELFDAVREIRAAQGALALTRPSLVSVQYAAYIARVASLVALVDEVLDCGVEPALPAQVP